MPVCAWVCACACMPVCVAVSAGTHCGADGMVALAPALAKLVSLTSLRLGGMKAGVRWGFRHMLRV